MLVPLPTRLHDENQSLKSCIKLRYHFWHVCQEAGDVATPKTQVRNFMSRLIIILNFKFLAMVVSEFLLNLLLKSDFLDRCLVTPDCVNKPVSEISFK